MGDEIRGMGFETVRDQTGLLSVRQGSIADKGLFNQQDENENEESLVLRAQRYLENHRSRQAGNGFSHEKLYADAQVQRMNNELRAREHHESSVFSSPAITKQAAKLVRPGPVGARLFSLAQVNANANANANEEKLKGPNLNQRKEQPLSQSLDHTESLYRQALQAKEAKERKEQLEAELARRRAKPKLNRKTKQIAAELGQTSKERLLQQKDELRRMRREVRNSACSEDNFTFKPRINPRSLQILADGRPEVDEECSISGSMSTTSSSTHERLYRESTSRQARRRSLEAIHQKSKASTESKECTFKPNITPFNETKQESKKDIVSRLTEWEQRRSQRLELQRKQKEAESRDEECTFAPKTNTFKKAPKAEAALTEDDRGIEAFLERQKRARAEKRRKQEAMNKVSSSKWVNRVTVPVAPKLGTAQHLEIAQESRPPARSPPPPPPPPPSLEDLEDSRIEVGSDPREPGKLTKTMARIGSFTVTNNNEAEEEEDGPEDPLRNFAAFKRLLEM